MALILLSKTIDRCLSSFVLHKDYKSSRLTQVLSAQLCIVSKKTYRTLSTSSNNIDIPSKCDKPQDNPHLNGATDNAKIVDCHSYHTPIMTDEVIRILDPSPGKKYIDMTFGAGGHSYALVNACPDVKVIGLDRDLSALKLAQRFQDPDITSNLSTLHGKFSDLPQILLENDLPVNSTYDGVLIDAGFSSMQMNDRRRGFALATNGPLDMRMDPKNDNVTAAQIVNRGEERYLKKIFKLYGQERYSKQIAQAIVEYRQMMGAITHTRQLQDIVAQVYRENGAKERRDKLGRNRHPATLVFQALRIFVNDELNQLYAAIQVAHQLLKPSCPCAIITFHSLEHLIVDQCFRLEELRLKQTLVTADLEKNPKRWRAGTLIRPSEEEVALNPKSRASQLRFGYKIISTVGRRKR